MVGLLQAHHQANGTLVSYDTGYDDGSRSLSVVACSDGPNGLETRYGWQTQSQVSRFPYIGGVEAVAGWNSPSVSNATVSHRSAAQGNNMVS